MRGVVATGAGVRGIRAADRSRLLVALRTLGVAAVAGIGTGAVIAGLGGRAIMKVIAVVAGPEAIGRVTANGNTVGDLTVNGTLVLVVFEGMFNGLIGGLLYLGLRPWLARLGRWRGVAFGLIALALMGHLVFDSRNFDFRVFGATGVNVGLFAALFILYGLALTPVFDFVERRAGRSRLVAGVCWLAVLPAVLLLVLGTGSAIGAALGQNTDGRPAFGLLLIGTLVAGAIGRVVGVGRPASVAIIALPVLVGAFITANELARILFG